MYFLSFEIKIDTESSNNVKLCLSKQGKTLMKVKSNNTMDKHRQGNYHMTLQSDEILFLYLKK